MKDKLPRCIVGGGGGGGGGGCWTSRHSHHLGAMLIFAFLLATHLLGHGCAAPSCACTGSWDEIRFRHPGTLRSAEGSVGCCRVPPVVFARAAETCTKADGTTLSVTQAAQVKLVWRLARRCKARKNNSISLP